MDQKSHSFLTGAGIMIYGWFPFQEVVVGQVPCAPNKIRKDIPLMIDGWLRAAL
jgi:hypothetical protein